VLVTRDEQAPVGTGEGRLADEHLVEHAGEAVDVAAAVNVLFRCALLRAHVRRRADREAGCRQAFDVTGTFDCLRDAEVQHQRAVAVDQDVVRLDVAVDDVVLVRIGERVGDLRRIPNGLLERQMPLAVQHRPQRVALDHRHRVVDHGRRRAAAQYGDNAGMVQRGQDVDLASKAIAVDRTGELGGQHLHDHAPLLGLVVGNEDVRHPAAAQLALDPARRS